MGGFRKARVGRLAWRIFIPFFFRVCGEEFEEEEGADIGREEYCNRV